MAIYTFEGKTPKISEDSYVHPQATIIGAVSIGKKCFIGPGAVLRGDLGEIEVGDGTNIQDNCVIHADRKVVISHNIIIGHGAIIHDAILKPGVVVGMGAVVMNGVVAEEDVIIGAGSVVKEALKIPKGKIAAGNPARIFKGIHEGGKQRFLDGLNHYQELTERYKKSLKMIE
ncbi:MAG: phenylacetic acid degradation protein PaaY [Deltaproteobacteria bacterium]|nr:phenylacetic acid degradation protein PaaY [Deltaproteobacteria bacterium]